MRLPATAIAALLMAITAQAAAGDDCDRGDGTFAARDYELAIANYTDCLELVNLGPKDRAYFHGRRGLAYAGLGRHDPAIADYGLSIRLEPTAAHTDYNRGNSYFRKRQIDRAIVDYDEALRLDPDYALAYNNRGFAKYR